MYYARTNKPGTQDSLALVLSLLWQVMSSLMCLRSHNKLRSHLKKKEEEFVWSVSHSSKPGNEK